MPNELAHIYVPFGDVIKTTSTTADGTVVPARIVRGTMTDETLDLDKEIVDYDWAKAASTKWWEFANIREGHSTKAVGKGKELEYDDVARSITLTSKIIDSDAIVKIDEGVLSGYSIGVKNARYIKDAKAPNGRLNGGSQIECSIVDHPSLPTAKFAVVKMRKDGKGELAAGVALLTEDDEQLLTKVVKAEETKLADTDTEKAAPATNAHGHLHPHNAGTDQAYEHDHGHEHGPVPLHDDGVGGDHQHDHMGTLDASKAAEPEVAKAAEPVDEKAAVPTLDGEQKQHNKPVAAALAAIQTLIQQEATESVVDFSDIARLTQIGSDLQSWVSSEGYESQMAVYMAAMPQVEKLIETGERKAAITALKAAQIIAEKAKAAAAEKTKEATVEPKPEDIKPEDAKPATEPSATETTDKTATADTMKAAISEAVTKAVDTAVSPLREKVDKIDKLVGRVDEMERRAAPGGPMLNGSKFLSAPEDVQRAALKARVGDIDAETLRDVAENHPDATMRAGAKSILADIAKAT